MVGRVCVLRHAYYPSDVRVRREVTTLVASGFDVDVICLRRSGQKWIESVDGVNVYRLPLDHRRASRLRYVVQYVSSLILAGALATILHARRHYDLIQVNTMPDIMAFAALLPKLLGARLLLDIQDLMPELYRAKFGGSGSRVVTKLLELQEGASIRLADRVTTVTEEFRRILVQRHGRTDIDVIMNLPDETVLPRRLPSPPRWRPEQGSRDRFILIAHGVLLERLGYDTIIRAVALLKESIPGLQLRVIGPGEYGHQLAKLAVSLGVDDRVSIVDAVPLDDIPERIADADLGIVANKSDGFSDLLLPTKLLEYVWLGKPTVVARTQTILQYFDDTMVAYFHPGDEQDLARAILDLYRHPEQSQRFAINATRFFQNRSWSADAARYRNLLLDLLHIAPESDEIQRLENDSVHIGSANQIERTTTC